MKNITQQIRNFGMIGILNTGIDFILFNLFLIIFFYDTATINSFLISRSFSFVITVVISYYLNSRFVFNQKNRNSKLYLFILISSFSLLVNVYIGSLVYSYFDIYKFSYLIVENFSAIIGTLFSMFINFIGYKYLVFKKS